MNVVTRLAAFEFAADKHRKQRRKDTDASPYVNHVMVRRNIARLPSDFMFQLDPDEGAALRLL